MIFLINSVKNLESFKELDNSIKISKNTAVFGSEEAVLSLFAPTFCAGGKKVCLISQDRARARKAYEDIESISDENCVYYPEKDVFFYDRDSKSKENTKKRLEAMAEIASGRANIVVTTLNALTAKISRPEIFASYKILIEVGQVVNLDDLPNKLVEMGYERFPSVEGLGQFSIRGSIIDIGTQDANYRIELFDDEVDSIRSFEIESQRSLDKLEEITIYPIEDLILREDEKEKIAERIKKDISKTKLEGKEKDRLSEKFLRYVDRLENQETIINKDLILPYVDQDQVGSFLDYLDDFIFLIEEPSRIVEREEELELANGDKFAILIENGEVTKAHEKTFYNYKDIIDKLNEKTLITFNALLKPPKMFKPQDIVNIKVKSVTNYMSKIKLFKEDLDYYGNNNFKVILLGATEKRAKRLFDHLVDLGYSPHLAKNTKNEKITSNIVVTTGALNDGIEFSDSKTVFINYSEIYGSFSKKKKKKVPKKKALNFEDLKIGDYVVHEAHGVGKYVGTTRLEVSGIQKDYILIEYGGEDKLFLPIEALDSIYKYVQEGKRPPKVNKLNSLDWKKKKARAKKSIDDMADELIKLYATRENTKGFAFSEDSQYQRKFEDAFIYEETSGQLKSTEEIKEDMEKPSPMDRLLCADVGYGKTEVALRAAFKAILDGKQVAILVPTTILAQQHYNTIKERFKNFPVGVGLLSRFRSKKDQKMDLEGLKDGNIDIIVGTHRLLSKDVKFKDLGLLIIDEEQRFGVRHKEKLRMLKENVDTLTLTATPIPRTLQMSMIGIRDMSVIEDPPEERFPVETYVLEYNNLMVREAILKEIERGGQVYFLYNKVSNMENKLLELRKLVPEATFSMANGQMTEKALEDTMIDFIEGNVDVLVCSTIIETGMDVPNANTMIITDSNRLGLSQLYQLRGRIGRSSRIAYAYFTYDRSTSISEVAQKRLQAIKEFTEFGSGHKIAERDLEIRGSGSILGSRQSGHIEKIGYDLYMKYLKDAVMKLKGLDVEEEIETTIDLKLDSFIPKDYIADDKTRLEIYKKISVLTTEEEYSDLVDELIDRFSDFPDEVSNLMDIALLKNKAQRAKVSSILERRGEYRVRVEGEVPLPAIMEINNEFENISYSMGNDNEIILTKLKYPLDELKKLVTILYLHKKDTKTSKK
ncbi:transcription-repair coupling factor [Peptoniphilus harei]|uniref:Transcription-repair-coupling factor n=1 Tax=Peptoniphilus harei TaxID=54005 RepID=A0A2X1XZG4_9FIRM|nr:transcription-repair coupling factor [Peptoniphilus harei]QQT90629.1 transcription-repair coupling factor [Peptoniphilus harei]SPY48127.1 Transcription-repair-coupling factor [Peptoniphilus harei]